jgi:protein-S-isoprenylcysteine O-methyltransferase Ste14
MEKQSLSVIVGNIFFKYRSYLFVPILILLFKFSKPQMSLGSKNADNIFDFLGFLIALAGFLIRAVVIGYKKPGTSGRGANIDVKEVVTDGMYQVCRNPLYLANFLMWLGFTVMWWEIHFFIVIVGFFAVEYFFIIKAEESYLLNKFGAVYDNYRISVPAFFPRIKNFKKPDRPFNWNKVLKNETNLLLLLLAFPPIFSVLEGKMSFTNPALILFILIILTGWAVNFYYLHKSKKPA